MEKFACKMLSSRPPRSAPTTVEKATSGLSRRRTRWTQLVATLSICATCLSGCVTPTKIVCEEPKSLPTSLAEPIAPSASDYSAEVQSFLAEVERYFKTRPRGTTQ